MLSSSSSSCWSSFSSSSSYCFWQGNFAPTWLYLSRTCWQRWSDNGRQQLQLEVCLCRSLSLGHSHTPFPSHPATPFHPCVLLSHLLLVVLFLSVCVCVFVPYSLLLLFLFFFWALKEIQLHYTIFALLWLPFVAVVAFFFCFLIAFMVDI